MAVLASPISKLRPILTEVILSSRASVTKAMAAFDSPMRVVRLLSTKVILLLIVVADSVIPKPRLLLTEVILSSRVSVTNKLAAVALLILLSTSALMAG